MPRMIPTSCYPEPTTSPAAWCSFSAGPGKPAALGMSRMTATSTGFKLVGLSQVLMEASFTCFFCSCPIHLSIWQMTGVGGSCFGAGRPWIPEDAKLLSLWWDGSFREGPVLKDREPVIPYTQSTWDQTGRSKQNKIRLGHSPQRAAELNMPCIATGPAPSIPQQYICGNTVSAACVVKCTFKLHSEVSATNFH